jgi:inosine/xanthosine triphosphatase
MKTVIVASTNPVKIEAARLGLTRMFPDEDFAFSGVSVDSGVSDQPMSDAETYQGALNRVNNAALAHPDADYWVGMEGGLEAVGQRLRGFAWIVVKGRERLGQSRTATFILPDEVAALVHQGEELGHADDIVFGRRNSKQASGSVGILTGEVLTRTVYYEQAVILALIPFKNPDLSYDSHP